jgi:hypothetical protein
MRLRLPIIVLLALEVGCGSRPSPEEAQRQLLRHQQVKRHNRLFYVGLARGGTNEAATRSAFAEITRQLTWLPKDGRSMLKGLYRVDRVMTDDEGQVHALAVLERQAAADHLRQVLEKERAALAALVTRCERHLDSGQLKAARSCAAPVKDAVKKVRALARAAPAAVGDTPRRSALPEERAAEKLSSRLDQAGSRSKVLLVRVVRVIDGQQAGNLDVQFGRVATRGGYRLADGRLSRQQLDSALSGRTAAAAEAGRKAGAGLVVVGRVVGRFSSEEGGQFFAWARGRLRIVETTAGKVVGELSHEQIKGGHLSRKQACERAVDNAVTRLETALSAKLAGLD